jgi:hypothetical protein
MSKAIDYFYNEKGDYTITLFDEPIAISLTEDNADRLKRYFCALSLRIDVLQKMAKQSNKDYDQEYEDGMRQAEEDLKEPYELESDDDDE